MFDGESVDRDLARSMSCAIAKRPKMFIRIWIIVRIFDRLSNVIRILDRLRDVTTHNLISKPHSVPPYTPYTTELVVAGPNLKTSLHSYITGRSGLKQY